MTIRQDHKRLAQALSLAVILLLSAVFTISCSDSHTEAIGTAEAGSVSEDQIFKAEISQESPPSDLKWLTNNSDPQYASAEAQKGGTFRIAIKSFPLTFRTVGPDSNTTFRGAILGNQLSLIGLHPNTMNVLPELATHWAYGKDKKTKIGRAHV